jgi:serine/threonine protein kinase
MSDANPGLMTIFAEALELSDPAARAAYLDRACGGDAALRQRVEALLAAHAGAGRFLEPDAAALSEDPTHLPPDATAAFEPEPEPPTEMLTGASQPIPSEDAPPAGSIAEAATRTVIADRYILIELIGEGGMGSVYLAEQTEPVKRQVALKLIKNGTDSRAVLARFDAERQALALMDHPNIARVFDGGTTEQGQPFFVMELVRGVPLTEYCDQKRLPVRARLELFVSVCQAVQHAHQKGIIHRDLKPGNVLVTEVDGRATPKVIDFGVAKATEVRLTDLSYADTGAIVGTPAYMSPEQADPSSMDIDTRTDVHALGVMLYELLVGSPPIDARQFKRGAILEMLRMVREVDPPRPSTRLSAAEDLPNIAANRDIEPAKLARSLRGELDWVVMKALEKDRTRRYDTANGLARDLQRYLADEVVEARPPSRGYRLKKFVRRHKGQVIAARLVLLALLAGLAGTTWGLFEARHQEQIARDETDKKEKALREEAERVRERDEANDKLLNVGARGLLRALAVQVQPNQPSPPLNDFEIEPLWELAAATDEGLRLRFVELALDDPAPRRRLKDRAPFAFQAAVGLDPTRRTRVEELLGKRLQASEISPEEQEQVAFWLAHLGGLERRPAGRTAAVLIQAMSKTTDPRALQFLAEGLSAMASRLEPKEAAATLTQTMSKTTDAQLLQPLAQGLAAVLAHELPPEKLVDLLKHPLCVGEPRRLVLDQLARHYQRPFADQWDFVDYVQHQKLGAAFLAAR